MVSPGNVQSLVLIIAPQPYAHFRVIPPHPPLRYRMFLMTLFRLWPDSLRYRYPQFFGLFPGYSLLDYVTTLRNPLLFVE
jgi:hypothetical protein